MLPLQKAPKIPHAPRRAHVEPAIPDRRQAPVPRQRPRLPQPLVVLLQPPDRLFPAPPVPRAQVDEQGPVVERRGRILQGEVADDGEADALVRACHGGDAGEGGHGGVRIVWLETSPEDGGRRWRRILQLARGTYLKPYRSAFVTLTITLNVGFF